MKSMMVKIFKLRRQISGNERMLLKTGHQENCFAVEEVVKVKDRRKRCKRRKQCKCHQME